MSATTYSAAKRKKRKAVNLLLTCSDKSNNKSQFEIEQGLDFWAKTEQGDKFEQLFQSLWQRADFEGCRLLYYNPNMEKHKTHTAPAIICNNAHFSTKK